MTIRLKLTLVYSLILTVVVVIFSLTLFSFLSQVTLNIVERGLSREYYLITDIGHDDGRSGPPLPPPDEAREFERAYIQFRDLNSDVVERSSNLGDVVLPLSDVGLERAANGEVWLERAVLDGENFLILSQLGETRSHGAAIVQVARNIEDQIAFLSELRNLLIAGDLIIIVLAIGLGWMLAGYVLRPIDEITMTARTVGEERDFSRRVDYAGPQDEIGRLATTFNRMLEQLHAAYEQVGIALQTQRRFVADASHELRTPLTTIRGNLGLLQRDPPIEPAEQADVVQDLVYETERLMRLVGDLLVLARADNLQHAKNDVVQICLLLEEVCRQARVLDPRRTIQCICDEEASISGDADALKQVLLILLDNAITHTAHDAHVAVTSSVDDRRVIVRVEDHGPGIDAEHLPHIFERFYRSDASRTGDGTGLGLAIARVIIEAQGGTIDVESTLGVGSVFTLGLPIVERYVPSHA